MAKLTIGDKTVTVDDSFRQLSPEQQQATVEEIASSLGVGGGDQASPDGQPDPQIAAYTAEVLSGDPKRARAAVAQSEYERMPWYKQGLVAADDIARLTADGLTAGFVDKLGGKFSDATGIGPTTEERRQNTEDARSRAGWAGTAAEVAGGIYGAGKVLKGGSAVAKGVGAASPAAAGAIEGAANLAARPGMIGLGARTAGAAATGAGLGALNAAGHDQDIGEGALIGAAAGGLGNVAGEAIASGVGKVAGLFNKKPTLMTQEQLREAANAAYKASDDAGVILKPQALQRLSQQIQGDLAKKGYHPQISPEISAVLNEVDRIAQGNVTLQGMDVLRQIAGGASGAQNAKTKMLGTQIIEKIDDFLEKLNGNDVLMGNKAAGVQALREARRLWASAKKSEMIQSAIERATNNAAGAGSGGNIDNALRQQFKTILNNPKLSRGLTADERATMQLIVRGVKGEKLLRTVSKLSPNGNGLMAMLGLGSGAAFGPVGLLAPAAGVGARAITDRLTPARIERLSEIVRAGGDASATRAAPNAVQRLAQAKRGALRLPFTVGGILAASPAYPEED